jgi:hypothetical protein
MRLRVAKMCCTRCNGTRNSVAITPAVMSFGMREGFNLHLRSDRALLPSLKGGAHGLLHAIAWETLEKKILSAHRKPVSAHDSGSAAFPTLYRLQLGVWRIHI